MTDHENRLIASLASEIIERSAASGLKWDQACYACGLAAKSLAIGAHQCGKGELDDCVAMAFNRLVEGSHVDIDISVTSKCDNGLTVH